MRLAQFNYYFIALAGLLFSCDSFQEDALQQRVEFRQKEFSVSKNGTLTIPVEEIIKAYNGNAGIEIAENPLNGNLSKLTNEFLQYHPKTNFVGTDKALLKIHSLLDTTIILDMDTIKFIVGDSIPHDPGNDRPFGWSCQAITFLDNTPQKHVFISEGDTVSFNALQDLVCQDQFENSDGEFSIELLKGASQYGQVYMVNNHTITYRHNADTTVTDTTDVTDKIAYRITNTKVPGAEAAFAVVYVHIGNPCALGYVPIIDYYTLKVSEGDSKVLDMFENDLTCGLTKAEIKKDLLFTGPGLMAEYMLNNNTAPSATFNIETFTITTNLTPAYFDHHPNAFVQAVLWVNYKGYSDRKSIIVVDIVK